MALLMVAGDAGDPLEPYGAIVEPQRLVRIVTTLDEIPAEDQLIARLELKMPCQGGFWPNNGLEKSKTKPNNESIAMRIR